MTREPLTKEKIIKDLKFKQKAGLLVYRIVLPFLAFLLSIGAVGLCMGFSVLLLILMIIIAIPFIILIIFMCLDYRKLHKISDGNFYIVEDRLVGMAEDGRSMHDNFSDRIIDESPRVNKVLTFASYGDYIIGNDHDRGAAFNYSISGDMFYLVIMKGKKDAPVMVYNQRVYELKNT